MARPREPARIALDRDRGEYRLIDGDVRRRLGTADRREAEKALALYVAERERAAPSVTVDERTAREPSLVSVAACLAAYGQVKEGSPNAKITGIHIGHLLGFWHDKTLAQIKGSTCRAYVSWRTSQIWRSPGEKGPGKLVSAQTARRELQTLSAAIGVWHREHTLTVEPLVTTPSATPPHEDWLTEPEYHRLLKAARGYRWIASEWPSQRQIWQAPVHPPKSDRLERFLEIGFYSGTRHEAILGLRWLPDPNGVEGHVSIETTTLHRSGPKAPQTRKRNPPCRIHDRLLPRFVEWRAIDRIVGNLHIVHERGERLRSIRQGFETAVNAAHLDLRDIDGVDRVKAGLGLPTPHILRHSRVTLMLRAGVSIEDTAEYVGMSAKMVREVYGHHHVEYQKDAASA